jgi:hypothetical protein
MNLSNILRPASIAAGLALLVMTAASGSLQAAPITYTFTGSCSDCTGTATATLQLQNTYTPGNTVTLADLISFTWDGTDLVSAFTVLSTDTINSFDGTLPVAPGGIGDLIILTDHYYFASGSFSSAADAWEAGNYDVVSSNFGDAANFATAETPEPASFLLIGGGLIGLATLRRRKQ